MNEPKYLEHLDGAVPEEVHGYTVSSYSVALEGWRRGLTLKFINKNRRKSELVYSLSNGEREHVFSVARGDLVTREAIKTCMDKSLTKEKLLNAGIPTPVGKSFSPEATEKDFIDYANEIGYPLVVKPIDGTAGKGVITGIETDKNLIDAIKYVKNDLGFKNIIIEKYIQGEDYRLYVIGEKVIGIFTRDRANVIGDGHSTIKQLVARKNEIRATNPALKGKSKINLGHEARTLLKEKGYDFNSVPKKGEKVYLNTKNNVSSGGDPSDATDLIPEELKQVAVNAVKAIPGLFQGGVDMIIDPEKKSGHVLEINSRPHIRSHLFPMQGEARDIPKEVIDFYFPETKGYQIPNILYFDFSQMYKSFYKGYSQEFVIPDHPTGNPVIRRYKITNLNNRAEFAKKCRANALTLKLNGYIKGTKDGGASLVLAGNEEQISRFTKNLFTGTSLLVEEKQRKSPVKIGFEVINMKDKGNNNVNVNHNDPNIDGYFPIKLNLDTKKMPKKKSKKPSSKAKVNKSKKNKIDYKKEYEKLLNSTSWKITKPLRVIRRKMRGR